MKMKVEYEVLKQKQYNNITSLLIALQTWRIVGFAFLGGVSAGILHPAFGLPAGVGDILVGVTAVPFAYFLRKEYSWSKYALVVWNVLGIADLVMAVTLGRITSVDYNTMSTFPWILVPTFAVPLALALHGITLYRLRNTKFLPIDNRGV